MIHRVKMICKTIPLFLIAFSLLNATNRELGEVTITIDEIDEQLYNIQNALLYKNVSIEYDSTVLIQNYEGNQILVYPQLREGSNNVLRLIIGEIQEPNRNFYDIFLNLGSYISDTIHWTNEYNKVFLSKNGRTLPIEARSININGSINFRELDKKNRFAGQIHLEFDFPLIYSGTLNHIKINGSYDVLSGEYREISMASASNGNIRKKRNRSTIHMLIIFSVLFFLYLGFK
jgi:hypothetical protein